MSARRIRVVVTGIGVVSSVGCDLGTFWESCLQGQVRVTPAPAHWKRYYDSKSSHWSPLALPDYASIGLRRSDTLSFDPAALNAIYATDHALVHAGCAKEPIDERMGRHRLAGFDAYRCGAYVGTGLGCITATFDNYVPHLLGGLNQDLDLADHSSALREELRENLAEHPRVLPVASTKCMANSISSLLSIRYGIHGANETCVAACAAGSTAIARAYEQIAFGKMDFAIAGGTEYYGDRAGGVFMAFDRLNTLAKPRLNDNNVNRPFDADRTGFLFSQGGACILVLESLQSARSRGATVLAELKGAFSNSDAYSLAALAPDGQAIKRMIGETLRQSDVSHSDIAYINTHGTGTIQNDELEAQLIESEFPRRPLLNSSKSILGHTIGACGAMEAALTVLSITNGEVHPNVNLERPIRDLNFISQRRRAAIPCGFSQNFGFGGHNVGLVFAAV